MALLYLRDFTYSLNIRISFFDLLYGIMHVYLQPYINDLTTWQATVFCLVYLAL